MVLMVRPPEFHQHHPKPKNSSTSKTLKPNPQTGGQTSRPGTIIDLGPVRVSGKICLGQKSQAFGRSAWHLSWRDHWDMRKFGKRCWNRPGRLQVWPSQPFPARELIWWKKIPWYLVSIHCWFCPHWNGGCCFAVLEYQRSLPAAPARHKRCTARCRPHSLHRPCTVPYLAQGGNKKADGSGAEIGWFILIYDVVNSC